MSSTAGQAAEPSLSLHPRLGQAIVACLAAAMLGALAGAPMAAALGAAAVLIPVVSAAMAVRRIGRQAASLMLTVALAAPCVRLAVSVAAGAALWLAWGGGMGGAGEGALSFWGAFVVAALGTLAVETIGFAADFRSLSIHPTEAAGA